MPYLIDTDWVIDHLADDPQALALLSKLAVDGIAISIVTYMEVFQGTLKEQDHQAAQAKFDAFLAAVPVLPFSIPVAKRCAQLREALKAQKKEFRRRALDLIVAATALEYNLTLVTRNRDDYKDIPGLTFY